MGGLHEIDHDVFEAHFCATILGRFDLQDFKLFPGFPT